MTGWVLDVTPLLQLVANSEYEAPPSEIAQWSLGTLLVVGATYTRVVAFPLTLATRHADTRCSLAAMDRSVDATQPRTSSALDYGTPPASPPTPDPTAAERPIDPI